MAKKEKSQNDVYELVGEFFNYVKTQFEKNERVTKVVSSELSSLRRDIKGLQDTSEKIDTRLRHVERDVMIIREDVGTLGKIVGRDSTTIKSHGHRITRLERSNL